MESLNTSIYLRCLSPLEDEKLPEHKKKHSINMYRGFSPEIRNYFSLLAPLAGKWTAACWSLWVQGTEVRVGWADNNKKLIVIIIDYNKKL